MTTLLHPDRYSLTSILRKNGVVVHTSEGGEGGTAALNLVNALRKPGDRPSPTRPGAKYGAGYAAVATEDGRYIVVADANTGPYHAGGGINPCMWSICIPGRAGQSRAEWLDPISRQYIRGVARYIVDMHNRDGRVWPLRYRTGAQLAADKANVAGHPSGYSSHYEVRESGLTQTDHWDPGPSFPWDVLDDDIADLIDPAPTDPSPPTIPTPTEDDDMQSALFRKNGKAAIWKGDGKSREHVATNAQLAALTPIYGPVMLLDESNSLDVIGAIVVGADPGDV